MAFSFVDFSGANLSETNLNGANLLSAEIGGAKVSSANIQQALNVTEEQLEQTKIHVTNPYPLNLKNWLDFFSLNPTPHGSDGNVAPETEEIKDVAVPVPDLITPKKSDTEQL